MPATPSLRRRSALWVALLAALLALACADRQRRNPLDPRAENPVDGVMALRATAGDGEVHLEWDYTLFEDVTGLRLTRTAEGAELVRDLPSAATALVDAEVANGVTYQYRLALLLAEGGERRLEEVAWATPGPGAAWVADGGSGLVWQVSPDGRSKRFARGRFFAIAALALNPGDGSCWVSDERIAGLYRIDRDGGLVLRPAGLQRPGDVSIDSRGSVGWVVDQSRRSVYWFAPEAGADSLVLAEADASFEEPVSLVAVGDACWIADRAAGRVLLYHRDGARLGEWRGLDHPQVVVSASSGPALAWVLAAAGRSVVLLEPEGIVSPVNLPFSPAVDLQVDAGTGTCWLLGDGVVAAVDLRGNPVARWAAVEGGLHLAVDGSQGSLWITRRDDLWKLSSPGAPLAQLIGFSWLVAVAVDPGIR